MLLHSNTLYVPYFFFNDTATTEIYTLSLHDALPISARPARAGAVPERWPRGGRGGAARSEEHTSELQSHVNLVCRLLLEKKKKKKKTKTLEKTEKIPVHCLHSYVLLVILASSTNGAS